MDHFSGEDIDVRLDEGALSQMMGLGTYG